MELAVASLCVATLGAAGLGAATGLELSSCGSWYVALVAGP